MARIAGGVPWQAAGTPPPAAGNGSAMRAAPIGLLFGRDPAALVRAAHDQGRVTHQDPRCSAGAIAIAGSTALAARGGDVDVDVAAVAAELAGWARPYDEVLADALARMPAWVGLAPSAVASEVARVGIQPDYTDGWEGISPFVTGSVLWSLYCFLRSPDDYWETVCTAVGVGGDVDTTAAMAGAISGARVGLRGIPAPLARLVNDQGTWQHDELVRLARDCYRLVALQ